MRTSEAACTLTTLILKVTVDILGRNKATLLDKMKSTDGCAVEKRLLQLSRRQAAGC